LYASGEHRSADVIDDDTEPMRALVNADAEKWWPVIKEFGIKAE
jgi:hypothetical protein